MKLFKIVLLTCFVGFCWNSVFGQTWTQATNAPSSDWFAVASSADGNKLVAVIRNGSIYTSTNSGVTWNPSGAPAGKQWQCVASSANGTKIVAADANGTGIFTSTNSGATWMTNNAPIEAWWSVASSADGTKLVAVTGIGGGPIYTSSNSGKTWNLTKAPTNYWSSVTSSANGTKLAAAQLGADTNGNYNGQGSIYTSTNSGTTWTRQTNAPIQTWTSIASSADGNLLIAAGRPEVFGALGGVYTSANSGETWISNSVAPYSLFWNSVATSADGSKMEVVVYASNGVFPPSTSSIYTSTNLGATWQTNNSPNSSLYSIASSADGSKLVVVADGGGIWTSQTTPSPQLNVNPLTNKLALSWIIASTNFVVQQSSDLISWIDLTNTPILNFTNLNNELFLSPTSRSGFFRLSTQ